MLVAHQPTRGVDVGAVEFLREAVLDQLRAARAGREPGRGLTGLAVYLPLQAGLWNIGAEGQLFLGAIVGT